MAGLFTWKANIERTNTSIKFNQSIPHFFRFFFFFIYDFDCFEREWNGFFASFVVVVAFISVLIQVSFVVVVINNMLEIVVIGLVWQTDWLNFVVFFFSLLFLYYKNVVCSYSDFIVCTQVQFFIYIFHDIDFYFYINHSIGLCWLNSSYATHVNIIIIFFFKIIIFIYECSVHWNKT